MTFEAQNGVPPRPRGSFRFAQGDNARIQAPACILVVVNREYIPEIVFREMKNIKTDLSKHFYCFTVETMNHSSEA